MMEKAAFRALLAGFPSAERRREAMDELIATGWDRPGLSLHAAPGISLGVNIEAPHGEDEARRILERHGAEGIRVGKVSSREDQVDEASRESFPASDPPAYIRDHAGPPKPDDEK